MSHLPPDYDEEIRGYLAKAEHRIKEINLGRASNYIVTDNDWFEPSIGGPKHHESMNELQYYTAIRDALRIGLEKGVVPNKYSPVLIRGPDRVRGLLANDNPVVIA